MMARRPVAVVAITAVVVWALLLAIKLAGLADITWLETFAPVLGLGLGVFAGAIVYIPFYLVRERVRRRRAARRAVEDALARFKDRWS